MPETSIELNLGDGLAGLAAVEPGGRSVVVADPPQGLGLSWKGAGKRRRTALTNDRDRATALAVVRLADRGRLPLVVFGNPYKPYPGTWRNVLVWDKGAGVGAGGDPDTCWLRTVELVYVARNGRLRLGRHESVLRYPPAPPARLHHPAEKPLPLMRYLIEQLTDPGDLVIDPCAGSGSTAIACWQTGRRFRGWEIDAPTYDVACRRIDAALAHPPLFTPPRPELFDPVEAP